MIDWFVTGFTAIFLWISVKGMTLDGGQSSLLIAGFMGGLVRGLLERKGSPTEKIIGGVIGAVCSYYFTPALMIAFGFAPHFWGTAGFVVGMTSMYLGLGIIEIARRYSHDPGALKDAIKELILRLITPKK